MTEWNDKQLGGKVRNSARSTDPITGDTDNSLVAVVDLDTRQFHDTEFIIENTGGNPLYYEIHVRNEYSEEINFTVFSNTIPPGTSDEAILARHARVFIYMKSDNLDAHTTYSVTGMGGV